MTKRIRIRRKVGDIVKIELGDGVSAFARVLLEPLMAFYAITDRNAPSLDEIVKAPVLFKIWVMNNAVTSGRWPVIGNVPLGESMLVEQTFFKVDPLTKEYSLYRNGEDIPAKREDCIGLERAAIWSAAHVEDRLRDYFAGVPNKWVIAMAP